MEYQPGALETAPPRSQAVKRLGAVATSYGLLITVTVLKPFSNLFLAWGMRQFTQVLSLNPVLYFRAVLDPIVALGIIAQVVWLLTRMSLLSVADLSFVLPVTSAGYVLSTVLGRVFLHEPVSASRWAGAVLISLGAALVVSTPEKTSERPDPAS